jgi:hypothetical protein
MRLPKHPQNVLLRPLNEILGTPANVRLLRAQALSAVSLTSGELAKRAQLGRTSIYPALDQLERAGIIEFVGAGSQRQVQIRDRHPLARALRQLFQTEARRFEELIATLRELLTELPLRPISAWAEVRAQHAQSAYTIRLFFVARPEEVESLIDALNSRLAAVEQRYDVHIAVTGLTRTELRTGYSAETNTLGEVMLLDGVPPLALLESRSASKTTLRSHDEHDVRSRRLALAVATKIKRDPGLIDLAEDRIKRRAAKASPGERRELAEWMRVLSTMSPGRLRRFLVEDSERAARLRQSLPALNVLSRAERDAVVKSRTDADAIAAVTRR